MRLPDLAKIFVVATSLTALAVSVPTQAAAPAGAGSAEVTAERQPHMFAALGALIVARDNLAKASHGKGGHRAKALALTNQAIDHVKQGITFDNIVEDADVEVSMAKERLMEWARQSLRVAINQLKVGSHDKGGHRVKALALAKKALQHVKKGIAYGPHR